MPLLQTRGASAVAGFGENLKQVAPITEPNIGDSYGGGFYFGKVQIGSDVYRLIAAPSPAGQQARASGQGEPFPLMSVVDGKANTARLSTPAVDWAKSLTINGFNDWYIPARDEVELMYRNLKPTAELNFVGNRSLANGEVGPIANGVNVNSVPPGAAYTTTDPPQTPLPLFQKGGGQEILDTGAFSVIGCSTYMATSSALLQRVGSGEQTLGGTVIGAMQRAIRRVKV